MLLKIYRITFVSLILLLSTFVSGCVLNKSSTPPFAGPAILQQHVYATIEYVCCVEGQRSQAWVRYEYTLPPRLIYFSPKRYAELHPAPYFVEVADYQRKAIWHVTCSDCLKTKQKK